MSLMLHIAERYVIELRGLEPSHIHPSQILTAPIMLLSHRVA